MRKKAGQAIIDSLALNLGQHGAPLIYVSSDVTNHGELS